MRTEMPQRVEKHMYVRKHYPQRKKAGSYGEAAPKEQEGMFRKDQGNYKMFLQKDKQH